MSKVMISVFSLFFAFQAFAGNSTSTCAPIAVDEAMKYQLQLWNNSDDDRTADLVSNTRMLNYKSASLYEVVLSEEGKKSTWLVLIQETAEALCSVAGIAKGK